MLKLTWTQAAAWRAQRHYLGDRAPAGSMLAIAGQLCGLHAQVMSSAELTVWARVEGLERGAVQRALWQERTLVKTWAQRGTLHLLPAQDLRLWHALLAKSRRWTHAAAIWKRFGLTVDEMFQLTEAVGTALEGRMLTREELAREVGRMTGSKRIGSIMAESSWGTLLRPAAFTGRLCFAPSIGQRVRFTHPRTWVSTHHQPADTKEAAAEVTRRYLAAYGPATHHDMARWWSGEGVATVRKWTALLDEEVCPVEVDGTKAWMLAADTKTVKSAPTRSVRLLPAFDQYILGASCHTDRLLPGNLRVRVYRPQGWISPVLLVNGKMAGVWRHEIKGSRVEVTIEPFVPQPAWVHKAVEREAERLARFLGCTLSMQRKRQ